MQREWATKLAIETLRDLTVVPIGREEADTPPSSDDIFDELVDIFESEAREIAAEAAIVPVPASAQASPPLPG